MHKETYLVHNTALTMPIIWCTMMSTSSSFRFSKSRFKSRINTAMQLL